MAAPASPSRQNLTLYAGRDVILIFPAVNDEDGSPYVFEAETVVSWWLGLSKVDTSNNSKCWADWTISAMFG